MDENFIRGIFVGEPNLINVKIIRDRLSGLPAGYGFLEFSRHEAASNALNKLNGKPMPGTSAVFRLNWAQYSGSGKLSDLSMLVSSNLMRGSSGGGSDDEDDEHKSLPPTGAPMPYGGVPGYPGYDYDYSQQYPGYTGYYYDYNQFYKHTQEVKKKMVKEEMSIFTKPHDIEGDNLKYVKNKNQGDLIMCGSRSLYGIVGVNMSNDGPYDFMDTLI